MQDNSRPYLVAVKDVYEMHSLASAYPAGTIYVVNNKCYVSCEDGSFVFFDSVAAAPVVALFDSAITIPVVEETKTSYPDEDTYRI